MEREAIERLTREGCGLTIYRSMVVFVLLVAGFILFPGYEWFVALGIITANLGFGAVMLIQSLTTTSLEMRLDRGERTTRHTIVLANEWAASGRLQEELQWKSEDDLWTDRSFWSTVHARVSAELDRNEIDPYTLEPPKKTPWWKAVGLVTLNVGGRFVGDLVSIVIAYAIAGGV